MKMLNPHLCFDSTLPLEKSVQYLEKSMIVGQKQAEAARGRIPRYPPYLAAYAYDFLFRQRRIRKDKRVIF
jgi:hypothetical protein